MGKSQRDKGANAEREVVHILEAFGIEARRGQVFNGEPDIVSDFPLHLEIKRQETTKIHEWMRQSVSQCRPGKIPAVVHRRSREDWLITMNFKELLQWLNNQ
jgi:hypothetical protein